MKPTNNIGYLLQHTSFSMARQSDQVLQEQLGIGLSQFKIMMVLRWSSNMQQRQIADALGQTEASISRQIKLMHDQNLLQTTISPQNRREHITTLTAKGLRMTQEALKVLNRYHAPTFAVLTEKQQKQFVDILKLLHGEVCKGERPGRCYLNYLDSLERN
jgi:DNA-binding MarR family transcriptional regulator